MTCRGKLALMHQVLSIISSSEELNENESSKTISIGTIFWIVYVIFWSNHMKAHLNVILDSPERAVEYLGLASLLMRLLDLLPQFDI